MILRPILSALMVVAVLVPDLRAEKRPAPAPMPPQVPAHRGRPQPATPPAPAERADEETTPQLTSFQLDLFELLCPADQVVSVNAGALQDANTSAEKLLEALKDLGEAKLLVRIADTADLAKNYTFQQGKSVPVVQSMSRGPGGTVTPSVSYRDTGLVAELQGRWTSDSPQELNLKVSIELANLLKTSVQIDPEISLPAFGQTKLNKTLILTSGRPAPLLIASDLPYPQEGQGNVLLYVLRTVAARVDGDEAQAVASGQREPDPWQTMIGAMLLEFNPARAGLTGKQLEELLCNQSDRQAIEKLEELGEYEVLSRPTILVRWPQEAAINVGESMPVPVLTADRQAGAGHTSDSEQADADEPEIKFEDVGVKLSVTGEWLEGREPAQARLAVVSRLTRMREVNLESDNNQSSERQAESAKMPVFQQLSKNTVVREGQRVWLVFKQDPRQEDRPNHFFIVGLTLKRVGEGV